jgi:hypothetical protein
MAEALLLNLFFVETLLVWRNVHEASYVAFPLLSLYLNIDLLRFMKV